MAWLSSRHEDAGVTMRETRAEMMAEEAAWRLRMASSLKTLADQRNESATVPELHVQHPKLYCGRCGGTMDKPFEQLKPFREVNNGTVTTGWRCG